MQLNEDLAIIQESAYISCYPHELKDWEDSKDNVKYKNASYHYYLDQQKFPLYLPFEGKFFIILKESQLMLRQNLS